MKRTRAEGAWRQSRQEIIRASHRSADRVGFYRTTAGALRRVVPFAGACWITFDPATLLFTSHFSDDLPAEGFALLCKNEYQDEDFNTFAQLTLSPSRVGVLREATGGDLERSPRYRTLLRPFGLEGELRASFVSGGSSWGGLILLRAAGEPDFTPEETAFVRQMSEYIAHGLRTAVIGTALEDGVEPSPPGLILIDAAGAVDAATPAAVQWLEALRGSDPPATGPLPAAVLAVASRARRAAHTGDAAATARARAQTVTGQWLVLHGTVLETSAGEQVAIIIEPAGPAEIAPLITQGYGLSDREREVTTLVLRGLATQRIAKQLRLSPYTVQDHLKSIFQKMGVRSRKELVAHVFFQHHQPRISRGDALAAGGWFAPSEVRAVG